MGVLANEHGRQRLSPTNHSGGIKDFSPARAICQAAPGRDLRLATAYAWAIRIAVRAVLIAAKALAFAKTRLAPALPDAERAALAEAMYRDVLAAALGARAPAAVAVITSDAKLLALSRAQGAIAIDEGFPRGLNVAAGIGADALTGMGATELCTLLSDCPLITPGDVDDAFAALPAAERAVALVPSRDLSGTNIIVRRPPAAIPTSFGRFSLARHRESCRARGIACEIVPMPRPAIDIDAPEDLIEFARTQSMTHTFSRIARLGMIN